MPMYRHSWPMNHFVWIDHLTLCFCVTFRFLCKDLNRSICDGKIGRNTKQKIWMSIFRKQRKKLYFRRRCVHMRGGYWPLPNGEFKFKKWSDRETTFGYCAMATSFIRARVRSLLLRPQYKIPRICSVCSRERATDEIKLFWQMLDAHLIFFFYLRSFCEMINAFELLRPRSVDSCCFDKSAQRTKGNRNFFFILAFNEFNSANVWHEDVTTRFTRFEFSDSHKKAPSREHRHKSMANGLLNGDFHFARQTFFVCDDRMIKSPRFRQSDVLCVRASVSATKTLTAVRWKLSLFYFPWEKWVSFCVRNNNNKEKAK